MPGAFRPMSFSLSTCHHGLKTAPEGDFFNSLMNFSTDSADIIVGYSEHELSAENVALVSLRRCDDRARDRPGAAASLKSGFIRTVRARRAKICRSCRKG